MLINNILVKTKNKITKKLNITPHESELATPIFAFALALLQLQLQTTTQKKKLSYKFTVKLKCKRKIQRLKK